MEIQTQWRVGFSGPVGLDYNAVHLEAARLEIDLSPGFMKKIKALERFQLNKQNADRNKD